jgi:uncharacterized phage protein (TIGR02218 family)
MKSTTQACADLLQSARAVFMVELVTLTLADGTSARWTVADVPISYGGAVWAVGPIIERDSTKLAAGLEVQSCSVTLHAGDAVTIAGIPLLQAAIRGLLAGASVLIQKGFTDSPANPLVGIVHLFEGRVGDVETTSTTVQLDVRTHLELLDTMIPLNVYQPKCVRQVYDAGCGINKAANSVTMAAAAGSSRTALQCAVTGSGIYDLGDLVFLSGPNAGVRRAVKSHTPGVLLLSYPLPSAPGVGDSFTVAKGCPRTLDACGTKFGNAGRFKGFPFVPAQETAV